jgi:hypothetical protein
MGNLPATSESYIETDPGCAERMAYVIIITALYCAYCYNGKDIIACLCTVWCAKPNTLHTAYRAGKTMFPDELKVLQKYPKAALSLLLRLSRN